VTQDQCLTIPPDHPLAIEFYDLQCSQSTFLNEMLRAVSAGDTGRAAEMDAALVVANESIKFLQMQYRRERGADDSCTVGLTIGANGYPVVNGRPADGSPFVLEKKPADAVRN
jgi:hypothetical protein